MNKINRIIPFGAATLLMLASSSCGLFTQTIQPEPQLPADREPIANIVADTEVADTVAKADAPVKDNSTQQAEVIGEWAVVSLAGHEIGEDTSLYLIFDSKAKRIYGDNGCNTVNGSYSINPADSTLRFENVITTLRSCPDVADNERAFNIVLDKTRRYTLSFTPELAYILNLQDATGSSLMTLQRQDFSFLNGTWTVTEISGKSVNNPDVQLVFDIPEHKLHGNTGCNILNGTISVDFSEHNSISFQQLITTRMACPEENVEHTLLVALEQVMYARPVNATSCILTDYDGKSVLALKRVSEPTGQQKSYNIK